MLFNAFIVNSNVEKNPRISRASSYQIQNEQESEKRELGVVIISKSLIYFDQLQI